MNYGVWDSPYLLGSVAMATDQSGLSYEQCYDILCGQPLTEPLPSVKIKALSKGRLPGRLDAAWPSVMVSGAMRAVLEAFCAAGDIQFIEAAMPRRKGADYAIANVLVRFDCVDWDQSRVTRDRDAPHIVTKVKRLVLKEIPPEAPPLFRIQDLRDILAVRDDLRAALEAADPLAGLFVPIDKFKLD